MSRLNPLKPVECKRTVSLETVQSNHEIQESKLRDKRDAYKRKNEAYIKSLYGNQREKEEARKSGRAALLQQIEDHDVAKKCAVTEKAKESQFAINYDKICLQQDHEDRVNKGKYLQQFRDENKKLMEIRAEQKKAERESQHIKERRLLDQSPINWSHTLH